MSGLIDLAARVEAAEASEQRAMLYEAFHALRLPGEYHFDKMLDAEAYESAAMTLVPERRNTELRIPLGARAEAYIWEPGQIPPHIGHAATPALALVAAALRARASINPQGV